MKYFLFFILFFNLSFGQKVVFESSADVAFVKAKKLNKLVFIEYYNTDCTICMSIQPLFENKEMADFYNTNFVNYKINTKGGLKGKDSLFMAERKLKFMGVPFFLFFDSNKNFVHYSGAKNDLEYLINIGKKALNSEERTGSLQTKYEAGDRSIKTLYAYSDLVQLYQNDALSNEISSKLFDVFPKQNLATIQSYLILKNSVKSIDNGFFIYWYENKENLKDFEKGSQKGTEIKVLEHILLESIQKQKSTWNLETIRKVKKMTVGLGLSKDGNDFLWEEEAKILVKTKQNEEAISLMKILLNESKDNIFSSLYITDFYIKIVENMPTISIVKDELDVLSKLEMEPEQKGDLLYQQLLCFNKMGDAKKSIEFKKKVLEYYQQNGLDLSILDNL